MASTWTSQEYFIIARKNVNKSAIFQRKLLCARLRMGVRINKLYGVEAHHLMHIFYICPTLATTSFNRNIALKCGNFTSWFQHKTLFEICFLDIKWNIKHLLIISCSQISYWNPNLILICVLIHRQNAIFFRFGNDFVIYKIMA